MVDTNVKIQAPVSRPEKVTVSAGLALVKKAKELELEALERHKAVALEPKESVSVAKDSKADEPKAAKLDLNPGGADSGKSGEAAADQSASSGRIVDIDI